MDESEEEGNEVCSLGKIVEFKTDKVVEIVS